MAHASAEEAQKHYIKIYWILLALLVVSVLGPLLEIQIVTMITAFGVALVKAYLVIKNFMHIGLEKKWIGYLMVTVLALMAIFIGGVSPDVMKHDGHRWENISAKKVVAAGATLHGKPLSEAHGEEKEHGAEEKKAPEQGH